MGAVHLTEIVFFVFAVEVGVATALGEPNVVSITDDTALNPAEFLARNVIVYLVLAVNPVSFVFVAEGIIFGRVLILGVTVMT